MQVKELEQIETTDSKKQENCGTVQESDGLEEHCGQKDFKVDSVIHVSRKTLDFPLINGEERKVEEVEFGNLVELECLQVKVGEPGINGLELSKLTKLKELELSRVPPRLSACPFLSAIVGLKCLNRLSVCHFSIRYLPPEIGCLNNLEYLDLSFNKMRNLPDEITSLNLLIQLKVTNNKLIDPPLRLSCPQRLEILDLSNNQLTSLKYSELESMHNFRILNLQVRIIEVSEASADEVRNFKFSCLREVRMLSTLKHSCIIECYGHQISSKWLETANGNSGRRILQSAILMEYLRGGSLKCCVLKLSSAGEKHVAPDLALSIARDGNSPHSYLHPHMLEYLDLIFMLALLDGWLLRCSVQCISRTFMRLEVDSWSFGCMLLELLTLQVPYSELPESEIQRFLQNVSHCLETLLGCKLCIPIHAKTLAGNKCAMGERPKLTDELEALAQSEADLETESKTLRFLAELYHQCTEKNPSDRPSAKNIYSLLLACEWSVKGSRSSEQE
ncbi:UNVERIFIED_CONTAM: hypothetical protein Sindi_0385000 [Sesamum indicum]